MLGSLFFFQGMEGFAKTYSATYADFVVSATWIVYFGSYSIEGRQWIDNG
jgi:hypothetical protein